MGFQHDIDQIIDRLKTQRDEVNVKVHLAGMEVRDEWEELEKKWDNFVVKANHIKNEVKPVTEEVQTAVTLLEDEIKEGYRKIKQRF